MEPVNMPPKPHLIEYASLLLSLSALCLAVWVTIRTTSLKAVGTEQKVVGNERIELDTAEPVGLYHVQAEELHGKLLSKDQPNVTEIGQLLDHVDANTQDIVGVNVATANTLQGLLTTPRQPNITSLGPLSDNLHMGKNDILNAATVFATQVEGQLLTLNQPHVTEIGQLTTNLNMNKHDILNPSSVTCNTFDGTFTTETQARITKTGAMTQDVDFGATYSLRNTGRIFAQVHSLVTLRTAAVSPGAGNFGIIFNNVQMSGNMANYMSLINDGVTTKLTSLVTGTFAATIHRATWSTATPTMIGWLNKNGSPTNIPPEVMYTYADVPQGHPPFYHLPTLIFATRINDSIQLVAKTNVNNKITISDSNWNISIMRLH